MILHSMCHSIFEKDVQPSRKVKDQRCNLFLTMWSKQSFFNEVKGPSLDCLAFVMDMS